MQIVQTINQVFLYLNGKRKDEKEKIAAEKQKEFEKKVDDVIDNGTIDDLLDLKKQK